jgi:hypothetical protein
MTSTSNRRALVAGLGLATLAGCVGELDVGKLPFQDPTSTSGDGSEGSEDPDGPGMTSGPPSDSSSSDDGTSDGTSDDTTTGAPPEISPPCELGGPGPGHDPAVQWGVVCGGTQQELVHSVAVDGTGAVYLSVQVEGSAPATVLMGDDEIPSGFPPTLLVTKLAPDGEILWNRFFEGEETWWYGGSIAACDDRVYLVANRSGSPELIDFGTGLVDGNMAVVAFDTDGQTQWAMATGQDDESSGGFPVGVATCRGDGVVIRGATAVDVVLDDVMLDGSLDTVDGGYVVVLDADGNASWGAFEPTITAAAALGPSGELVTLGWAPEAAALTRYAADGSLVWQQSFPTTGTILLTSVAIDDAGEITVTGGFGAELDLGLGAPLVNADPPDDPFDPTDDFSTMDGFVSHHDASGLTLWTTTLAEPGYDHVSIARLAPDGMPAVLWNSATASQLLATDGLATVAVATLPGMYVQAIGGNPNGGFALAWAAPSGVTPFAPPLTERGGYDFTIVRLVP